MEAVAAVLDQESWTPLQAVIDRANCGRKRTVRSALSQLREEGRVEWGGPKHSMVYRLAAMAKEDAA